MSGANGRSCGEDVAAYVLGALEPEEADAFRRHIADCPSCRDEVASLEHVTEALPPPSATYEVPRSLRGSVMREVRATPKTAPSNRPRRARPPGRFPLAWAGGLAVVLVAVIVAVALSVGGSNTTRVIHASVGSAELHITGGRGDLIVHRLPQLPAGRTYEMWVQHGRAQPVPTGTLFSVNSSGAGNVGVPGSLEGVSAVLVSQEPAGGSPAPTSAPVIVAPLS